jgi:protease-4
MKQFLLTVAGVLVGLTLFMVTAPVVLLALVAAAARPAPLPARTVLSLDLRDGLTDQAPPDGLSLFNKSLSVMGVEEALDRAARDDQVKALFVRLPEAGMAPAAADELRSAFLAFRAAGKPILAYSQGLYPQGVVTSTYELAAASGDIWMQPSASFQATGLASQDIFFKRFFDKYGVKPDFEQRSEYKTAINPYLYSDYTPAHRESELSWLGSVYDTSLAAAAQDRKLGAPALRALIEAGPYGAEAAQSKGLVDHVGEVKEAEEAILQKAGAGAQVTDFSDYAQRGHAGAKSGPVIALIQAEGALVTGTAGHSSPLGGGQNVYADDLAQAFYNAIKDKDVKAIVFRLSSPGGSDTASEEILSAVRAAKAAGKPVVVSMGVYGASGGYWVSSQANEIVAQPSTLTGSIGVFGGKLAVGDALSKFGIDARSLNVGGSYAGAFDFAQPMNQAQRAAFSSWMDHIYDGFLNRVAQGRHLPAARVSQIAKGRVWTGAQAKSLGLVDSLGGLPQAVERAKALGGVTGEAQLKAFSTRQSPFAAIARLFGAGADSARILSSAGDLGRDPDLRNLVNALQDARLRQAGAMVLAPRWVQ